MENCHYYHISISISISISLSLSLSLVFRLRETRHRKTPPRKFGAGGGTYITVSTMWRATPRLQALSRTIISPSPLIPNRMSSFMTAVTAKDAAPRESFPDSFPNSIANLT